jgi:hypothetical protein
MSNFYNPDYPVSNPGGFTQHIYQQNTVPNNMFWYGGAGSFNMGTIPADSRRNDGMMFNQPQFPTMSTPTTVPQFGNPSPMMSAPTTNPSGNNGMPFSSYPATQPTQQPAFNSLVESRRFAPTPQTDVSNNPWAVQNQPVQPQFPTMTFPQTTMNVPNPWMYSSPINYNDPNCTALYSNTQFGFDRGNGSWDNGCFPQRTIVPPNINWGTTQTPQYQYPTYTSFGQAPTQVSWKDAADKNWGSGSF